MSFERFRLLTLTDCLKVSLPAAALLCVFFMKPVLESYLESAYREKLSAVSSSLHPDNDKNDADFIRALTDSRNNYELHPFHLSYFDGERFLKHMFNPEKTEDIQQTEAQDQALTVPQYIPVSVFNGRVKKYAVLGGVMVRPGDTLSNGDKVTAIGDGCVLIEGKWGKQWFYVQY